MDGPHFTVVIATYNQQHYLKLILEAFKHHYEHYYSNFDIVVCDDGSSPLGSCAEIETPYELTYTWIQDKGFRIAKAKNTGVKLAKDWVLVFDGDTLPNESTFTGHIKNLEKNTISMGLRYRVDSKVGKIGKYNEDFVEANVIAGDYRIEMNSFDELPDYYYPKPHEVFSGVNIAYHGPTVMDVIGANNEGFTGYGLEDQEMALRWIANGGKLKAANDSICYHIDHPAKTGSALAFKLLKEAEDKYLAKAREICKIK